MQWCAMHFGVLGMQRVGLTHSIGNEPSRRIAERLGFALKGYNGRPTCSLAQGSRQVLLCSVRCHRTA